MTYVASQVGHQLCPFEGHLLILETPDKKEKFDQSKTLANESRSISSFLLFFREILRRFLIIEEYRVLLFDVFQSGNNHRSSTAVRRA